MQTSIPEVPMREALYAVSVYINRRSPVPVRFYFATAAAALKVAGDIRAAGCADRVLTVQRTTPEHEWRPLIGPP